MQDIFFNKILKSLVCISMKSKRNEAYFLISSIFFVRPIYIYMDEFLLFLVRIKQIHGRCHERVPMNRNSIKQSFKEILDKMQIITLQEIQILNIKFKLKTLRAQWSLNHKAKEYSGPFTIMPTTLQTKKIETMS